MTTQPPRPVDSSLLLSSKYDDDADSRRHQKKCRRQNNLAVTVNDAAPWLKPKNEY